MAAIDLGQIDVGDDVRVDHHEGFLIPVVGQVARHRKSHVDITGTIERWGHDRGSHGIELCSRRCLRRLGHRSHIPIDRVELFVPLGIPGVD